MSDLEFTGERFVPGKSPGQIESEHLARYIFALNFIKGKKALDLGCGEGYGSKMLAGRAESAVGVDIDDKAIAHAVENYQADNLKFVASDVCDLPFDDNEFDAVVSFEVIEHIVNPKRMLEEIARILKPDGILLLSTPNGAVKIASVPNPFHIKEFNRDELESLIRTE
ncbi:MAG TPA: class I SAM-dependent methyltransferase, partial [Firmicutes bacterium]|nr:class I SAM-dependent methyltransferase [Bacillota bacterium]